MLKISTKGQYGVAAMLYIAQNIDGNITSIREISQHLDISEKYLGQIFLVLKKNSLVNSIQGAKGGYTINKDLDSITIGMILRSLEGSLQPVHCVTKEKTICSREKECVTKRIWNSIGNDISSVVDSISLKDLLDNYTQVEKIDGLMYHI